MLSFKSSARAKTQLQQHLHSGTDVWKGAQSLVAKACDELCEAAAA
jgi:hypothetical protein